MLKESLPIYIRDKKELKETIIDDLRSDLEGEPDEEEIILAVINEETIDFDFLQKALDRSSDVIIDVYQCVYIKGENETIAWLNEGTLNLVTLEASDRIIYQPEHYAFLLRGETAYDLGGGLGSESEFITVADFVEYHRDDVENQQQIDELLSNPQIRFVVG